MTIVLLTAPDPVEGEMERIIRAMDRGEADLLHLRRPAQTRAEAAEWLERLPARVLARTVLHDHHDLIRDFPALRGLHLTGRHPAPPAGYSGPLSRSCHSLEELQAWRDECDYLFLSPIFDSISKAGYAGRFTTAELEEAHRRGLIDEKVYALGGVTRDRLPLLRALGFGGAVLLGAFWGTPPRRR